MSRMCKWFGHKLTLPRPEVGMRVSCPRCGTTFEGYDMTDRVTTSGDNSVLSITVLQAVGWREVKS